VIMAQRERERERERVKRARNNALAPANRYCGVRPRKEVAEKHLPQSGCNFVSAQLTYRAFDLCALCYSIEE